MTVYLLAFLIFAVAGCAQNVSGFGFGLVSIPLLTVIATPQTAVVAASVLNIVITGTVMVAERRHVDWRVTARLAGTAVLGMPLGLVVLRTVPSAVLTALIAIVVTACTAIVWRGWRLSPSPLRVAGVGAFSGVLLTATGTNGPPLVAALQAVGMEPRAFRATLAAVFTGSGLVALAGFLAADAVSGPTVAVIGAGLAGTLLGGWAGSRLFRSIDAAAFRRTVVAMLLAGAGVALVRAAQTL